MKFGGSSIADAQRILAVAEIVRGRLARRPVVVVSALAGVTDLLVRAVRAACAADLEVLEPILADLERRHRWALAGSVEDPGERHDLSLEIDGLFEELRRKLRSIRILGEGTARAADSVFATGELLSARIVAAAFRGRGLPARFVDPRDVVITDSRFGEASPDVAAIAVRSAERLTPLLGAGEIPVLGGFVGATPDGDTTTLGRGGSDTSAAVLGAALGVEEIQIWTDVDGMMSADPRLVPLARTIPRLSFAEAAELAFYGAKVLHPDSIAPAVERKIPVRVLNSHRPAAEGSVVLDAPADDRAAELVSVASRVGVRTIRVLSRRMRADAGFVAGVLDTFRASGIAPDLVVASEVAVHAAIPADVDLARVVPELDRFGGVEVHEERAIVCIVGSGLMGAGLARRRALEGLAAFEPEIVGVGASAAGLAAVLPASRLVDAVRGLHHAFFEDGASR